MFCLYSDTVRVYVQFYVAGTCDSPIFGYLSDWGCGSTPQFTRYTPPKHYNTPFKPLSLLQRALLFHPNTPIFGYLSPGHFDNKIVGSGL